MAWVLQTLKSRSQKNTSQLFYLTLVEEWRGKSHRGLDISGKMGTTLNSKTYGRHKRRKLREQEQENAAINNGSTCIWWVDNFNKWFLKSYLNVGVGIRTSTAWTAFAFVKVDGIPATSLRHRRDIAGRIKPAYPDQAFNAEFVNPLVTFFASNNNFQNSWLWTSSSAKQIFNTPLRLPALNLTQEEIVYGSNIGLKNFYPVDLLQENISSTTGLCKILRLLRRKYWKRRHYFLMKVDINIYWRMAKVCIIFFLELFLLNFFPWYHGIFFF